MNADQTKIFPIGDNALTIEFGNEISEKLNRRVLALSNYFENNDFEEITEIVPAYASLSVFYDVRKLRKNFQSSPTAFEVVKNIVLGAVRKLNDFVENEPQTIEIPVSFRKEFALDLEIVARVNNLTADKVIEIFLSRIYRVYMLGFLPGFAYMGEVDERIQMPRKDTPRKKVPLGSVGIAGLQTGIYSLESPGGWQIIGRTETELFRPDREEPTILKAGDLVKFVPVK